MKRYIEFVQEGKKTLKCEFCDNSCSQTSNLNSHIALLYTLEKRSLLILNYSCSKKHNLKNELDESLSDVKFESVTHDKNIKWLPNHTKKAYTLQVCTRYTKGKQSVCT